MNTSNEILKKSIKELEAKRESIEFELYNINNTITGIEAILLNENKQDSGPSIKNVTTKTSRAKKRRRKRTKQTSRVIITEGLVRDAIIELAKNPPRNFAGAPHKPDSGFFTCSQVGNKMGLTNNHKTKAFLEKFSEKGILESRPYKNGKQYRYIKPVDSRISNIQSSAEIRADIKKDVNRSNPIPGINNNGITARNKDIEKLLNKAIAQGFVVTRNGSDHATVRNTLSGSAITIGLTGNKAYEVTKLRSDLSKMGVLV